MMDFLKEDVDRLLSYHTKQQVKILDRWLGFTNVGLSILIVLYIVGYVFWYCDGYLEYEYAKGVTSVHVNRQGDVVVPSTGGKLGTRSFSVEELTYPNLENGNVFIATKVEIAKENRGVCEDPTRVCETDDDCQNDVVDSVCGENKMCMEPSWCPIPGELEVYKIPSGEYQIWAKSMIQFWNLRKSLIFTNDEESRPILYPEDNYNAFTVRDLLLLCSPPVRYEEISELGAAIEVQLEWRCAVPSKGPPKRKCRPQITARRVDSLLDEHHIGFKFSHPIYDPHEPESKRSLQTMKGIRIYFKTWGVGEQWSQVEIIFKISTGIALLGLAPLLADLLMLKFFPLAKKYAARKYEYSQDLGDYFEELKNLPRAQVEEDDMDGEEEDLEDIEWRRRMDEEDD